MSLLPTTSTTGEDELERRPDSGNRNSYWHRWRKVSVMVTTTVLTITGLLVTTTAADAHYNSNGMPYSILNIKPYSYTQGWQLPMNQAIADWNQHSRVQISKHSSVSNYAVVSSYADTFLGFYTRWSFPARFRIRLNSRTIGVPSYFVVRSIFGHEWGHVFSLGHNSIHSIMNTGRNRNELYRYTAHDANDVVCYYHPNGDRRGSDCQ